MNTKIINFALPIELYERVANDAKAAERSISAQIRFMLIEFYKSHEKVNS